MVPSVSCFRFHRRTLPRQFLDLPGQRLRFGFHLRNLGFQALRLFCRDLIEQIRLLGDELVKLELRTFAQLVRRFEDAQDFEFQALP